MSEYVGVTREGSYMYVTTSVVLHHIWLSAYLNVRKKMKYVGIAKSFSTFPCKNLLKGECKAVVKYYHFKKTIVK